MKLRFLLALFFSCSCLRSVPLSAQEGNAVYKKHCANCHDTSDDPRAPGRAALRHMAPEQIIVSLETGAMKREGANLTPAERRTLAEYLSDHPFSAEAAQPMPQSAFCAASGSPFRASLAGPGWNGWGVTLSNTRFQPHDAARLTANEVPRLKLRWAFGFPGDINASSQPVVAGGRLFIGSFGGKVYSLDARSGCIYWVLETEAGVRSAVSIGKSGSGWAAYFGDLEANVYAADAASGKLLWKEKVDTHPVARITGALKLHDGRLYVPVASGEEGSGGNPNYECCTFRGSVVALDAATGKLIWKTYTIVEDPRPTRKSRIGTQLRGPSGAAIWSSPTLDLKRNAIYAATGNSYSNPSAEASDAVIAFDMKSGKIRWIRQFTKDDTRHGGCRKSRDPDNCPNPDAPDFDFGASPILVELPGGRRALIAGQKSGLVHALDPDRDGEVLWQERVSSGGELGGILWGPAADAEKVYVAIGGAVHPLGPERTLDPKVGGGIYALKLGTGKAVWYIPPSACGERRPCSPAQSAAVTAIPGVVFSGSLDGHLRAYSAENGKILWDYDTEHEHTTVNGVKAKGGSVDGAGPGVVAGMLFVNSGYGRMGGMPGNVLLAFSVDGN